MTQRKSIFNFDSAIVRAPSSSVVNGLQAHDRGAPTWAGVKAEHDAYVMALRAAGLSVEVLPPLEAFPDSIFVEDTALVFTEGAILLQPGAATRRGETTEIAAALRARFEVVLELGGSGSVDGGDVLATPGKVFIGRSARTDDLGAQALVSCLARLGRVGHVVGTPPGVLHFKSDCALLDDETILTTARLAESGVFQDFRQLLVPQGEEPAANAVRINDVVLLSSQYPRTLDLLVRAGYEVVTLQTIEIARLDAGLTCMSLRYCQINSRRQQCSLPDCGQIATVSSQDA